MLFSKKLNRVMVVILLVSMIIIAWGAAKVTQLQAASLKDCEKYVVVIDAGHGGNDPGKVGVNGLLEKDVNLDIALRLRDFLELQGIEVVMTRTEDKGLYDETASNKKVQDMNRRIEIIDGSGADIVVSVHQNSYPTEDVRGPQIFYYKQSTEGQKLAKTIQNAFSEEFPEKKRTEKANDNYYLLRKTKTVTVITECGFLSNWEEAELLKTEYYREKVAWTIYVGIVLYLNES